jgi:hypothetical protein
MRRGDRGGQLRRDWPLISLMNADGRRSQIVDLRLKICELLSQRRGEDPLRTLGETTKGTKVHEGRSV